MPQAGPGRPPKIQKVQFSLLNLFPEFEGQRRLFPKQQQIFDWTISGEVTGGGIVYQSGKGGGKTLCGSGWIIWAHHQPQWKGLRTLIGRETFPALLTSTADEFWKMVNAMPDRLIKRASQPSKNSMGYVEWTVGGVTMLCSLSDSNNWESANLGAVWVDEGHRQQWPVMMALMTRIRQIEGPRVMLVTQNPAGKGNLWKIAAEDSKAKLPNWRMLTAGTDENPALPADYLPRLYAMYGKDTPAARRWIKGLSSALEGVVFPQFDPNPESGIHVIPRFPIPDEWYRSRGMDYGQSAPTVAVYAAQSPWGDWFVMKTHSKPGWTIPMHAEVIRTLDEELGVTQGPGDPTMFHKVHQDRMTGVSYSAADFFFDEGVNIYPGPNDRKAGLAHLMKLIAPDETRQHPITGEPGAPGLYIFDDESNEPLIHCLSNLLWDRPDGTPNRTGPDDAAKKDDHEYDCCLEGTRVRTEYGEATIEAIEIGERVWTRTGLRRVTDKWLSSENAELIAVGAGGKIVRCTPRHRFFVRGKGLVRADALSYGDELWALDESSGSSSAGSSSDGIQTARGGSAEPTFCRARQTGDEGSNPCTAKSGRPSTDPSRPSMISTTRTSTPQTTPSRISNAFQRESTPGSIPRLPSGSSPSAPRPYERPQSGTAAQREEPGIRSMDEGLGRTGSRPLSSAVTAEARSSLCVQTQSSAATTASPLLAEPPGQTTRSGRARSVRSSSESTATACKGLALVSVELIERCGRGPVWNLSVEGEHEFFANGICVSNSLRYLVMDRPTVREDSPVAPRRPVALNSRGSYVGY